MGGILFVRFAGQKQEPPDAYHLSADDQAVTYSCLMPIGVRDIKSGNVNRHFETKHIEYGTKSGIRTSIMAPLKASLQSAILLLTKPMNISETASESSMHARYVAHGPLQKVL
jgi:hypothetical protein